MSLKSKLSLVIERSIREGKTPEFISVSVLMLLEDEGLSLLGNGWVDFDELEPLYEDVTEFLKSLEGESW